ncbi:NPCBM/NEW2 domain-containing protein [Nonomuraea mangrovi]|uniref:NPCBM/NEW2 domain-containing protein n=1 Tax=Nonomuraea mangrovi TaxID=2316207 RepID=A0ABW4T628_9ACTN
MRKPATWLAALVLGASAVVAIPATAHADTLDSITGFGADDGAYTITAGSAKLRLTFQRDDVFRLELAPDGVFTDPANTGEGAKLVVKTDYPAVQSSSKELDDRYEISTGALTVAVTRKPVRFSVRRADGSLVWAESAPLSWDATGARQALEPAEGERFFGGGMQNGRLEHTGSTIRITRDFDWDDGGNPNAAPYYMSTAGYGAFRNTFAPGGYDFRRPSVLTHQEQRFDAYYFVAAQPYDLKTPLDRYTELTGRPMMPPIYGLELGDADCYHKNANRGQRTPEDAVKVAQGYVDHDMPRGWMLVNDGYGCGYERLDWTGQQLRERGIQLGLWTESRLDNQQYEVGTAGVRVRKLDVAWVGAGYRHALTACEDAHGGIERYSDARGYAWMVEGWAGSQRCAVQWTGDHDGTLDAIRWQIPAITGAGMSGMPFTAGDIDGIFGGTDESYVRDLQWKAFTPVLMSMSGWAAKDKQPWARGEPYTSINRRYLKLRERLLPYLYTYAAEAHRTGLPVNRALALEYPRDEKAAATKDQFLAGRDFLVAPVSTAGQVRNGIYLPEGRWVDYWSGQVHDGPKTIDGYHAPLDRLPLFVRAGAIVPMHRAGINNHSEVKPGDPLTLDIYPLGDSAFDLYLDDGKTRAYREGVSATQRFTVDAPDKGIGVIKIGIAAATGPYQVAAKPYELVVHTGRAPAAILYGKRPYEKITKAAYEDGTPGWYAEGTLVKIRLAAVEPAEVELIGAGVVGGLFPGDGDVTVAAELPALIAPGSTVEVPVTFTNRTGLPVRDVELGLTWSSPTKVGIVGDSVTRRMAVTVPENAKPGAVTLIASASYKAHVEQRTATAAVASRVPHRNLAAAFDNAGITDDADTAKGNIDGGGSSFSWQRLATIGLTPGARVQAQGVSFTWPNGSPDNVTGRGQTIAVEGQGNTLAFLGTGTSGSAAGTLTLHYADGSVSTAQLGFANWCCLNPSAYGSVTAFATMGKNTTAGPNQYPTVEYRIFYQQVRLNPDKQVVAITMPDNGAIHVFAATVATKQLPAPPQGEVWASDHPWLSATNGWGPVEKDLSNGDSGAGDGRVLSLGGVVHAKGLGTHAPSTVSYYAGGRCGSLTATVGVDDEIPDYGSVVFKVVADGKAVYTSPVLTGTSVPVPVTAELTGAQYVDLVVEDAGNGNTGDHADWASARFTC